MAKTTPSNCIESPVRGSESKLWDMQRTFYRTMGIEAWNARVPFYITSNAFIGQRYATLVIHALQDWLEKRPEWTNETFYILEVGSGTGKFSFYFLKALEQLLIAHRLEHIQYCYIISDIVESNLTFCEKNKQFASLIEKGKIDFALFDLVRDNDIALRIRQQSYTTLNVKTPLCVVANYVLDSIIVDLFKHTPDGFEEIQLGLNTRYKTFDFNTCRHLDDLRLVYDVRTIDHLTYYPDPIWGKILENYHQAHEKNEFFFTLPIGATCFLQTLSNITHENYLLIAGDKAVSSLDDLSLMGPLALAAFNGSFSFLVNFHALADYHQRLGGAALLSELAETFMVALYAKGWDFSTLSRTACYYKNDFSTFGPQEYCDLYIDFSKHNYRFSESGLFSLMRLSNNDPSAYAMIHERLAECLPEMPPGSLKWKKWRTLLLRVKDNIYPLPSGDDVAVMIGALLAVQKENNDAMQLFNQSIEVYQKKSLAYRQVASLYEKEGKALQAQEYYKKAHEIDPHDQWSEKKYLILSGKPSFSWMRPVCKLLAVGAVIVITFWWLHH